MEIEIKQVAPKYMTIDRSSFKYYLGLEINQAVESQGLSQVELDKLYFNICKRFEPYFKEREFK
jgi:hypothetical protein